MRTHARYYDDRQEQERWNRIQAARRQDRRQAERILRGTGRVRAALTRRERRLWLAACSALWLEPAEARLLSLYLRGRRICARYDVLPAQVQVAARAVETAERA